MKVAISSDFPGLSVGLHWDVWGEGERQFDISDVPAVRHEFCRQVEEFHRLMGCMPTHIDTHHHVHRRPELLPVFRELVEPLGVPLRGETGGFIGGFYAQWEWMVTNLEYVSPGCNACCVKRLMRMDGVLLSSGLCVT